MYALSLGRWMVAAAVAAVGVVALPSAPTEAATDDIVAIVIDGTGFGHGRGMSQWGAYGYAVDHGWNWNQILEHYYGGTEAGTVPASERVRVRLTALDGQSTIGVVSYGSPITWNSTTRASMYAQETTPGTFQVWGSIDRACPGASNLTVPDGVPVIATGAQGSTVEQIQQFLRTYQTTAGGIAVDGDFGPQTRGHLIDWQTAVGIVQDGTWGPEDAAKARTIIAADTSSTFELLGTAVTTTGNPVSFTIADGEDTDLDPRLAIGLCSPQRSITHYRGSIDVLSTSFGNRVVNDVLAENYVRGVIPREVSASWGDAGNGAGVNVLRAQAVAARSYGLEQRRSYFYDGTSTRYATTCDTTACQVYGGAARRGAVNGDAEVREDPRTDAAVATTANVVRRWPAGHPNAGQLVSTEFSASNGPRTAGGAFPAVNDIGDDTLRNPNHRWTRVIDADTLESLYGLGQLTSASMVGAAASQYQGYDGIWFDDLVLTGKSGSKRMNSWDFRRDLNLPSPGFTVRVVREISTPTRFGFIGDSVGSSIASASTSEFRSVIDGSFTSPTIDAVTNRCTNRSSCSGTSGVDIATDLTFGLDLVIVELGYNDSASTFADDVAAMMTALTNRGVKQVAWVNLAEIRTNSSGFTYRRHNDVLSAAERQWPNLRILDWNSAISDLGSQARWFSDGVHLTSTGQAEFALWLFNEAATPASAGSSFVALAPGRLLETRVGEASTVDGLFWKIGQRSTGSVTQLVVNGRGRVAGDAAAVVLNVTVTGPARAGYLTVYPCDATRPLASNLNYSAGQTIANTVTSKVSADGKVCIYTSEPTHLIADINGYFPAGSSFVALAPGRLLETRVGEASTVDGLFWKIGQQLNGSVTQLVVNGRGGVAGDAAAVVLNVTVTGRAGAGYLTVYPCDATRPLASNLNYSAGQTIANTVTSKVSAAGKVCIYTSGPTHLIADINGFFPAGSSFVALAPGRLLESRVGEASTVDGLFWKMGQRLKGSVTQLVVNGRGGVAADSAAVVLNVTVTGPARAGYLTVYPCDATRPLASNLNYSAGQTIANTVTSKVGAAGKVCIYTSEPTHLIADINGFFAAE